MTTKMKSTRRSRTDIVGRKRAYNPLFLSGVIVRLAVMGVFMVGRTSSGEEPTAVPKFFPLARQIAMSPDRNCVAVASAKAIFAFKWGSAESAVSTGAKNEDKCVAVSDDLSLVVIADASCTINGWEPNTNKVWEIARSNAKPYSVALSVDRKTVLLGTWNGEIIAVSVVSGQTVWSREHGIGKVAIATGGLGGDVATGGSDGVVRFWRIENGVSSNHIAIQESAIVQLRYSDSGKYIVVAGGFDQIATVVDVEQRKVQKEFKAPAVVCCVDISPSDRFIAVGTGSVAKQSSSGNAGGLFVWGRESGKLITKRGIHKIEAKTVLFVENGRALLSTGTNGIVSTRFDFP